MHYFIRANGSSLHNDPSRMDRYVAGEPPLNPFNYLDYSFRNNVARIGWPGTGDLCQAVASNFAVHPYSNKEFKKRHRDYLRQFFQILPGSVVLVPNKDAPGDIFMGLVTEGYRYWYETPEHPYECAHRVRVDWDRDRDGRPIRYKSIDLNIGIQGGFWMRAFHLLEQSPSGQAAIPYIRDARAASSIED
jgi:hypothetical protein